jgi:acetyl esterase/lipase
MFISQLCVWASLAAADVPPMPVEILLWQDGAPKAIGDTADDKPSLTIYLPAKDRANGTAVVVCPGGGYGRLAMGHEGKDIAEWLNQRGVAAFVLKYRLAPRYRHPCPLLDAQRAVRTVRSRAKEWGVSPERIGIWGFSAGGHLASTVITHFDDGDKNAKDSIDRVSSRPDFAILAYPVIDLVGPSAHRGSRNNLLGPNHEEKQAEALSNHRNVTTKTPPTFLFHTKEDKAVPPANSEMFHDALKKAGVPVEMHLYDKGPHGVGLAPKDPVLSKWPEKLEAWLKGRGLLPAKPDTRPKP